MEGSTLTADVTEGEWEKVENEPVPDSPCTWLREEPNYLTREQLDTKIGTKLT
jgi:hypothetical protein